MKQVINIYNIYNIYLIRINLRKKELKNKEKSFFKFFYQDSQDLYILNIKITSRLRLIDN